MTVFWPPCGRLPMIVPPPPDALLTSKEIVAFGHSVAAAFSRAFPRLCFPAVSRLFSIPPVSSAMIEIDWTFAPVAPGGVAFAVIRNWLACWTVAKALDRSATAPVEFAS